MTIHIKSSSSSSLIKILIVQKNKINKTTTKFDPNIFLLYYIYTLNSYTYTQTIHSHSTTH